MPYPSYTTCINMHEYMPQLDVFFCIYIMKFFYFMVVLAEGRKHTISCTSAKYKHTHYILVRSP